MGTLNIGLVYPNKGKKEKAFHVGLASIASYARTKHDDLNFELLDTRVCGDKREQAFYETKFDIIGITAMAGIFRQVLEVAREMKQRNPATLIVVGGPYVNTLGEEILDYEDIDLAVNGEGEETFSEIIEQVKTAGTFPLVNGIIYRGSEGKAITNPGRKAIRNIDALPMPAYDLFDMDAYPIHRIVTSRGCPYKCTFCSSAVVWDYKWTRRTAESLALEVKYLIDNFGRKTFFFNDDTFNMDMKRAEAICDEFIRLKLNILWSTPLRADRITPTLAQKMKKAGCYNVGVGIESANNAVLKRMDKQTTIEDITKGIRTFREAGIEVLGQFLIGNIGETWETFEETLTYAKQSELDFILFYSVLPYKGTKHWEYVEQEGKFLHHVIHEFQYVNPRIIFETNTFSYDERLKAIQLTKKEGFYVDDNRMNYLFDFGRTAAKYFQQVLPSRMGNWLFLAMKSVYRNWLKDRVIKM